MASIEHRSRIKVWVKNREDLTKLFPFNANKAIRAHLETLRTQGFKPQLASLDDHYVIRTRSVAHQHQTLVTQRAAEAFKFKHKLESEEHSRACS